MKCHLQFHIIVHDPASQGNDSFITPGWTHGKHHIAPFLIQNQHTHAAAIKTSSWKPQSYLSCVFLFYFLISKVNREGDFTEGISISLLCFFTRLSTRQGCHIKRFWICRCSVRRPSSSPPAGPRLPVGTAGSEPVRVGAEDSGCQDRGRRSRLMFPVCFMFMYKQRHDGWL